MRAPAFWWQRPGLAAALLRPLAAIYGAVAARRFDQPGESAGIPVVCIGDPTVGGGGKTPTALATAALLVAMGERPAFLTRGYGSRLAGPVLVDRQHHSAQDVGDEPLLLARAHPTVLARDRRAGARFAQANGASVIVMDDGFQNPALAKDCAVLVIDAARGLGNGLVVPAGPLRAPLGVQRARADAIVLVGASGEAGALPQQLDGASRVFRARLAAPEEALAPLRGARVLAFAGIGAPEKFYATLEAAGVTVCVRRAFADHHPYTAADATGLLREAAAKNLVPVTTEKDFVRLTGDESLLALRARSTALPVRLAFEDADGFASFLRARIRDV